MGSDLLNLGSILVVDDDDQVRDTFRRLLAGLGYDVDSADDGADAIPKIKARSFDLVITDLDMPQVDGMDLLESIKAAEVDTDVLLISGAGSIAMAVLAVKLGAVNFIEKPVTPEKLKSEVRKIFRARRARLDSGELPTAAGARRSSAAASEPPTPLGAPRPSSKIGRYLVTRTLGVGGMATVYECFDPLLQRVVAVKTLDRAHARELGNLDLVVERFRREAQAIGKLSHPNIVAIYDFGEDESHHTMWLAMERVEGRSIRQILSGTGPFPFLRALKVVYQVIDGLEYAHRHGVIHRDVKPPNILVSDGDHAKVVDFGVAKVHDSDLTDGNVVVGSIAYMAPEILRGRGVDHRADQFSLGHVVFEMLTGQALFSGSDFAEVAKNVLNRRPPSLSSLGVEVPAAFQSVLDRLLAKDPEERYEHELELLDELAAIGRELGLWLELGKPRRPSTSPG